jgi:hypothetical protein
MLTAALTISLMLFFFSMNTLPIPNEIAASTGQEEIGVYQLKGKEPTFLADVFPAEYSANGSLHIHQAHLNGLPHMGAWIHILDRC